MRRTYVLRRMTALGYIDEATRQKAAAEPIASRGFAPLYDVEAPYVAELVRQDVVNRFGAAAVNAGYKVFTTLDSRLQTAANRALRVGLIEYDRRHGYRGPIANVKLPPSPSARDLDQAAGRAQRHQHAAAGRSDQGRLTPAPRSTSAASDLRRSTGWDCHGRGG